ncbi:hypothetical protein L873DRAFT_1004914 [Choiromyces venosus 120613-1]|uniref:Uncharacterized protein n=1 Tax=Choiromyces venosus 120613-1 TaxID=1336337 RepID=A0A3N4JKE8_9PEZI|nr:hypothetical protein L873DRAFT_1004914 [Choiromyces venosus 120613-1]
MSPSCSSLTTTYSSMSMFSTPTDPHQHGNTMSAAKFGFELAGSQSSSGFLNTDSEDVQPTSDRSFLIGDCDLSDYLPSQHSPETGPSPMERFLQEPWNKMLSLPENSIPQGLQNQSRAPRTKVKRGGPRPRGRVARRQHYVHVLVERRIKRRGHITRVSSACVLLEGTIERRDRITRASSVHVECESLSEEVLPIELKTTWEDGFMDLWIFLLCFTFF